MSRSVMWRFRGMTKKQKLETRNSPPAPASGSQRIFLQVPIGPSPPSGKKSETWQIFARETTVGVNRERLKDLVRPPHVPFPRSLWILQRDA